MHLGCQRAKAALVNGTLFPDGNTGRSHSDSDISAVLTRGAATCLAQDRHKHAFELGFIFS